MRCNRQNKIHGYYVRTRPHYAGRDRFQIQYPCILSIHKKPDQRVYAAQDDRHAHCSLVPEAVNNNPPWLQKQNGRCCTYRPVYLDIDQGHVKALYHKRLPEGRTYTQGKHPPGIIDQEFSEILIPQRISEYLHEITGFNLLPSLGLFVQEQNTQKPEERSDHENTNEYGI